MNNRFKFRIAVYERQQNNMHWEFIEYIDPSNQHWGLNQCGDIISDHSYSAHYTRKNAPDSVHRVYEPEQCTGLKDKNGNLIYEGDVIQFTRNRGYFTNKGDIRVVEFSAFRFCGFGWRSRPENNVEFALTESAAKQCVVIGNIHEQAEQKDNE